jgi:hypothetical protein
MKSMLSSLVPVQTRPFFIDSCSPGVISFRLLDMSLISEPESVCSASGDISVMAEFDPEQFEDKYANYFAELQRAYKNAFESMNDRYDSELIHAIDQQILNESEPFYDAETDSFEIQLPENPTNRLTAIVVDDEKLQTVLETYVDELQQQHRRVFGLDDESEPKV